MEIIFFLFLLCIFFPLLKLIGFVFKSIGLVLMGIPDSCGCGCSGIAVLICVIIVVAIFKVIFALF